MANKMFEQCMHKEKCMKNTTSENSNKYKAYKNKVSYIIRSYEKMYYSEHTYNTKTNVKDMWIILGNISSGKR